MLDTISHILIHWTSIDLAIPTMFKGCFELFYIFYTVILIYLISQSSSGTRPIGCVIDVHYAAILIYCSIVYNYCALNTFGYV